MNSFINSLFSCEELEEEIVPKLLELNGFRDFLYKADVTFGSYKDLETGLDIIAIKCNGNNYVVMVEFADGKFYSIYKMFFQSINESGKAFELCIGSVLLEHFYPAHCSKLFVHWGKNELEMGGKK